MRKYTINPPHVVSPAPNPASFSKGYYPNYDHYLARLVRSSRCFLHCPYALECALRLFFSTASIPCNSTNNNFQLIPHVFRIMLAQDLSHSVNLKDFLQILPDRLPCLVIPRIELLQNLANASFLPRYAHLVQAVLASFGHF